MTGGERAGVARVVGETRFVVFLNTVLRSAWRLFWNQIVTAFKSIFPSLAATSRSSRVGKLFVECKVSSIINWYPMSLFLDNFPGVDELLASLSIEDADDVRCNDKVGAEFARSMVGDDGKKEEMYE